MLLQEAPRSTFKVDQNGRWGKRGITKKIWFYQLSLLWKVATVLRVSKLTDRYHKIYILDVNSRFGAG